MLTIPAPCSAHIKEESEPKQESLSSLIFNQTEIINSLIPKKYIYPQTSKYEECKGLTSISLSSRVSNIWLECFAGLTSLQRMKVDAVEPPALGAYAFNLTPVDKCKLIVPEESLDKYIRSEQWKDFLDTTSSVNIVTEGNAPYVRVGARMLYAGNLTSGNSISVCTMAGQSVYYGKSVSGILYLPLKTGVYVVSVNSVTSKIMIP